MQSSNEQIWSVLSDLHRERAMPALAGVIDLDEVGAVEPLTGGASGAGIYRLRMAERDLVLRVDTARDPMRNPSRSYPAMRAAADAGVAPAIHLADESVGVVLMDLVEQRPLGEHPGGTPAVMREIGALIGRLQRTAVAPALLDFRTLLDLMLGMLESSGLFADGVLMPIRQSFTTVAKAYPWHVESEVTSHNDINMFNALSDGHRLWIIDWELAFRNDPLADVAGAINNFRASDDDAHALLCQWAGREPDAPLTARVTLMRCLNQLYYGCLMMSMFVGSPQIESLDAPTVDPFETDIAAGRYEPGSADVVNVLGRMQLAGFALSSMSDEVRRAADGASA